MVSKKKDRRDRDKFSIILASLLLLSVFLAVSSYIIGFELEKETYLTLKKLFFAPLKIWIYPVIGAAMFSIFFRSPKGQALRFFILISDILILYSLSTLIANLYAVSLFPLFPFAETIAPIVESSESTIFSKSPSKGTPLIILIMVFGISASLIFRFVLGKFFNFISKILTNILDKLFNVSHLRKLSFFDEFNEEFFKARKSKDSLGYSVALINVVDKIIFLILMMILLLAPAAVFSTFLETLHSRGFKFFADLGKFILFYSTILLSYQFAVIPLVRSIFCFGIKGESYKSFLKKALPVIATAGTTASSVATLATNIKAAQSLNVEKDMKHKGHNRALMPIGATFNMDGTSISLIVYFLLAANLAGIDVNIWAVILTAMMLSIGTAAAPSASLVMLTSMFNIFAIPSAISGKLLSVILAVDPIHDRIRTIVNVWGDLNMVYIVQSKRGPLSLLRRLLRRKKTSA